MTIRTALDGLRRAAPIAMAVAMIACGGSTGSSSPTAPGAPTGLVSTPGDRQVTLSWTAPAGATGYNVYRSTTQGSGHAKVGSCASPSFTDTGLTNGTPYYYLVRATNSVGEGAASAEVAATPWLASTPPAVPTNVQATAGDGRVQLSWSQSAGATSYVVRRATDPAGTFVDIATPSGTSYLDTTVTNGTTYWYEVLAKGTGGLTSGPSQPVSATPSAPVTDPPPVPANVTATSGDLQVTLTWSASTGATSYLIERATAAGGPWAQIGTTAGTRYSDISLTNGTTYYYRVAAKNAVGTSGWSSPVSAVPSRQICVANFTTHTVAVFDPSGQGDVAPIRMLGNLTGIDEIRDVAYDAVKGEVYVASVGSTLGATIFDAGAPIAVHARTASGNVEPVRTIAGAATTITGATGVAVDAVHDEVFVASGGKILVFPRTQSGNVAPLRTTSVCTGCVLGGIAVDPLHDELFVPTTTGVNVYGRTWSAGGAATLLRTVSDWYGRVRNASSVAYDPVHDELVVSGATIVGAKTAVGVFPRTEDAFPNREILTDFITIKRVAVDGATGDIFVVTPSGIAVYPITADGATTPSRMVDGSSTAIVQPSGVAVSGGSGELFVGNQSDRTLVVHAIDANGNVPPLRTMSGTSAGILYPRGIASSGATGRLFVSNGTTHALTSYADPWSGTPDPVAIVGGHTALSWPVALAVDDQSGDLFVADSGRLLLFPFDAAGDVAPQTFNTSTLAVRSVAVDVPNGEVFVAYSDDSIHVLSRADGTQLRQLDPSYSLGWPRALGLDLVNTELVVLSQTSATTTDILVYPRSAAWSQGWTRRIRGAELTDAYTLAVDEAHGEYLVAHRNGSILAYSRAADGTPPRIIAGPSTRLAQPSGITVCK